MYAFKKAYILWKLNLKKSMWETTFIKKHNQKNISPLVKEYINQEK